MPVTEPAIVVEGLRKSYGGRPAVDGLSFTVAPGEVFGLLGPNGAGKTTTVETLEGYRRPDAGSVRVLGLDPIADRSRLRRRMGLMLQEGGVYPGIKPLEALRLFASFYDNPLPPEEVLGQVGLVDATRRTVRRLSGGQKQRLSLGLALIGRPEVVFLDEPTQGLDPQARAATWELIGRLRAGGTTVLLTTHYMDEAERLADRVAIIDRGRLVALDSPTALTQGDATHVRFRGPAGVPIAEVARDAGFTSGVEVSPGRYALEGDITPERVANLTGALAARAVLLTELTVGAASLEDVFLALLAGPSE